MSGDSKIGKQLKALRNRAGLSVRETSRKIGIESPSSYSYYEDGFKGSHLPVGLARKLADAFAPHVAQNEVMALAHGASDPQPEIKNLPKFAPQPYPVPGDQDVPIKGGTMGGSGGVFVDNGQDFGMARRPAVLEGVKNAYAVYVFGDSMEPKYSAGQLIFVNPNKPVSQGAFVVIQLHPAEDGGEQEYLVKRFLRHDSRRLQVEEFNYTAPRKFDIPSDRIIAIHRIVASEEA